ncbi:MAG TPA: SDR family oxidoreductase, partial [Pirellulaceae bacterium]|nr:SDR family oxidoreductase [Pirellulaceae bacterium]
AGFIGSHLVEALVARGDHVRVVDNLSTGHLNNLDAVRDSIEFFEGDVNSLDFLTEVFRGADSVFHQAALASVPLSVEHPDRVHHACANGTLAVLRAAHSARVRRVVYAASSSCYGNTETDANREGDELKPLSPYAAAKLAGEFYCQAFYHSYGLETVSLRYFNVFGPRQDPNSPYSAVIPIFANRLIQRKPPTIFGDGEQTRDFTYVGNVVQGNLLAASAMNVAGRSLNLADGRRTSLLQLLNILQQLIGDEIQPLFAPERPGEVKHSKADITLASKLLGYRPLVTLEEGLRRTVEHYCGHLDASCLP